MNEKVLIVEDDFDIQSILKNYLEDAGYQLVFAADGVEGIARFNEKISLVILDIMLPKIDGFGVCEVIRSKSDVPIIMLTALADEKSQLKGYAGKIDDYIPKPFSAKILLCKMEAILRRRRASDEGEQLIYKNLKMDLTGHHVFCDGTEVVLTQKEFELLKIMLENKGKVFTRQMLLDRIWGIDAYVEERIVDSHLKNLRKKLSGSYIKTIRGVGYRIDEEK